jgi:hypothetical protein
LHLPQHDDIWVSNRFEPEAPQVGLKEHDKDGEEDDPVGEEEDELLPLNQQLPPEVVLRVVTGDQGLNREHFEDEHEQEGEDLHLYQVVHDLEGLGDGARVDYRDQPDDTLHYHRIIKSTFCLQRKVRI